MKVILLNVTIKLFVDRYLQNFEQLQEKFPNAVLSHNKNYLILNPIT